MLAVLAWAGLKAEQSISETTGNYPLKRYTRALYILDLALNVGWVQMQHHKVRVEEVYLTAR